jgi:hypothetical protein
MPWPVLPDQFPHVNPKRHGLAESLQDSASRCRRPDRFAHVNADTIDATGIEQSDCVDFGLARLPSSCILVCGLPEKISDTN